MSAQTFTSLTAQLAVAIGLAIHGGQAHAEKQPTANPAKVQCTSTSCGNTATGEDPQEVTIRRANDNYRAIQANGTDKQRWVMPVFSTSKKPDDLRMPLVKAKNFSLRLSPKEGHLYFERPKGVDIFEFEQPVGSKGSVCPEYSITVHAASEGHALIEKLCSNSEYNPERFSGSDTFYLYDVPTSTLRALWRAASSGKDDPVPHPDPVPNLKQIDGGYELDWTATYPNGRKIEKVAMHNDYTRKFDAKTKKPVLVCTELRKNSSRIVEGEACEGGIVELIGHR